MSFKRFARNLALSALCAVATPVFAAGLVEGTSVAVRSVADAAAPVKADDAVTTSASAPSKVNAERIATAPPARLSALAGNDDAAWASARTGGHAHPH